jgi:hypothetical protein
MLYLFLPNSLKSFLSEQTEDERAKQIANLFNEYNIKISFILTI